MPLLQSKRLSLFECSLVANSNTSTDLNRYVLEPFIRLRPRATRYRSTNESDNRTVPWSSANDVTRDEHLPASSRSHRIFSPHKLVGLLPHLSARRDRAMPVQSKLTLPAGSERTIKGLLATLTRHYVSNRKRISRGVYVALFVALLLRARNAVSEQRAARAEEDTRSKRVAKPSSSAGSGKPGAALEADDDQDGGRGRRKKVELNREFFRSLLRLLRIVVPRWYSPEFGLILSHSFFLVARTIISLKVAAMDGAIVKSLIRGNGREFLMRIVWWMLIAVPATVTNSMVRDP